MHKHPALIIGTGVWARLTAEVLLAGDQFVYGFIAEDGHDAPTELLSIPVQGALSDPELRKLLRDPKTDFFLAVDEGPARERLLKEVYELAHRLPGNALHPLASIAPDADLASGNVLHAGCVVQHEVQVQALNYFSAQVVLECGARVGSFNTLQAGVIVGAGAVIEHQVYIGQGAIIGPGVVVAQGALVAPGAVVLQHVAEGQKVYGNPAAPTR